MNPLLFKLLSEADDDKKKDTPTDDDTPTKVEDAPSSDDLDMSDELDAGDDTDGTGTDETPTDDGGDDGTGDTDLGDGTDPDTGGDDATSGDGDGTTEDPSMADGEEDTEDKESVLKKKKLLERFTELYNFVGTVLTQLAKAETLGQKEATLISFTQDEVGKLRNIIYEYMIYKFEKDSYAENLVMYYKFDTSLKISNEIITKVNDMRNEK